jgi:hypothetical protein
LCAKNMPFLPAVFSKIKTGLILCKYNAFKVLRFHVHQYNILYLVQKVLQSPCFIYHNLDLLKTGISKLFEMPQL